jgi:SAM-dependent methyltransferase
LRSNPSVQLADIQAIYDGAQAQLYELFMGHQIHIGGLESSLELADLAGVTRDQKGVELCCGTGASMRALVRLREVASMVGVETSRTAVERGRDACRAQALDDRIELKVGDATHTGLPEADADFVWSEDAWCYVLDKPALVAEAVRLTRPGGVIAFTDWIEGPAGLADDEAEHVMQIMTFPSLYSVDSYRAAFAAERCDVVVAEDTGRFGPFFGLYAQMLQKQLTFDALELLAFSKELLDVVLEQLLGLARLGERGKLGQLRFVARRR